MDPAAVVLSTESLLTLYGPLALGWVFAIYLIRQNMILQAEILKAFVADTAAKVELKATVDRLVQTYERS